MGSSYSPEAQIMNVRNSGTHPIFDNVYFKNNATSSTSQSRKTAFIYDNSEADFIDCKWEGNFGWESMIRVQANSKAYFENNVFFNNGGNDWGIIEVHDNNCVITFVNSTLVNSTTGNGNLIGIGGNYNRINFINSVLGKTSSGKQQIRNNTATTNSIFARNSVFAYDTLSGVFYPGKLQWDVDSSMVYADPQLNNDGTLKANSPAIGIGTKQVVSTGISSVTPPLFDINGVTRPDPAGSSPDAGAYESNMAIGDFDLILS